MPEDKDIPNKENQPRSRSRRGGDRTRRRPTASPKKEGEDLPDEQDSPMKKSSDPQGERASQNSPRRRTSPKKAPEDERTSSVTYVRKLKGKRPIVALTAYDAPMAKLVSNAGVDFLLVGDSVGTTMLGCNSTVRGTLDAMVHHTAAVRRGNPDCLILADLPFGEASLSFDRLLEACRRLMQEGGADGVKIEGGKDVADDIERLIATGIPVMGHVGLLPQTVKVIGGYRKFANDKEEAQDIFTDAIALEEAGCFAIVCEMIHEEVAAELTRHLEIPTIGIGSGSGCDGQILVTTDVLGLTPGNVPSFVKPYAQLATEAGKALGRFVNDVREGRYPKA